MSVRNWLLLVAALVVGCGGGGGGSEDGGAGSGPPVGSDVSVQASAPVGMLPAGGVAEIEVRVSNSGPAEASGRTIHLNLDPALTLRTMTCAASGGARCPSETGPTMNLPAQPATGLLVLQLQVDIAAGASGELAGTVAVDINEDTSTTNNAAEIALRVYSADVTVSGTGPTDAVPAGSSIKYTMTVVNAGPDEALGVEFASSTDAQQAITEVRCIASGGAACPAALGPSMTIPSLPVGASLVVEIQSSVDPAAQGTLTTTAAVASSGDPVEGNNAASIPTLVSVVNVPVSVFELVSQPGDFVGQGHSYAYTKASAIFNARVDGEGGLGIYVAGDQSWSGDFHLPTGQTRFVPARYDNVHGRGSHTATAASMSWGGEGRGCNVSVGSFEIHHAAYIGDTLTELELSFEQHCEGDPPALLGYVRWAAADKTTPPGPINPPPQGLWQPPSGATPRGRNYVYLASDRGDYIGDGKRYTYTQADSILQVTATETQIRVDVFGDESWSGSFSGVSGEPIQTGYYADLLRPANPTKGSLSWSGQGRGCNRMTGWMVVDRLVRKGDQLEAVDIRFEQHCEGMQPALHGKIHWTSSDTTTPPGPVPPPQGVWSPPAAATPPSGNFAYLESEEGDYVGQGRTWLYTRDDSGFVGGTEGNLFTFVVDGAEYWVGDFQAMQNLPRLEPGYYADLQRQPFHNPAKGGLAWYGDGRGCNSLTGWFVVDKVRYQGDDISEIELRFMQRCLDIPGRAKALRGAIRWAK